MKFRRCSRSAFTIVLFSGNWCAAELNETAPLDLSCLQTCSDLICQLAVNKDFVPGGVTLLIVDCEGEARNRTFVPGDIPRVSSQPAGELLFRWFFSFGSSCSSSIRTACR